MTHTPTRAGLPNGREPNSAICNSFQTDNASKIVDAVSPPEISKKIKENSKPADYDRIIAPTLNMWRQDFRPDAMHFTDV